MTLQSSPYPRAPRWLQAISRGHLRAVAKEMEADALGDWPGVEEWRETLLGWAQELRDQDASFWESQYPHMTSDAKLRAVSP